MMQPAQQSLPEVFEGAAAEAKCRTLGIPLEILVETVRVAEMDRAMTSPLQPPTAPGYRAWSAACGHLAGRLRPDGWERQVERGLQRVVNKSTGLAVAIVGGDEGTGDRSATPRSRSKKGVVSKGFVEANQLSLFPSRGTEIPLLGGTWWLLIYSKEGRVRAELSLAVGLDSRKRLAAWKVRIIVGLEDGGAPLLRERRNEGPELEFEVNVTPR